MRTISKLVIHCTATPNHTTIESMQNYWRSLGWKKDGYHFAIKSNGEIISLEDVNTTANGVAGHNANSIHIAYIGGLNGDNRTTAQKVALKSLLTGLRVAYPRAEILGHRDFDGVKKLCPNFDAKQEYSQI